MKKLMYTTILLAIFILFPIGINAKTVTYTESKEETVLENLSQYQQVHFIYKITEQTDGLFSEMKSSYNVKYNIKKQTADIAIKIEDISSEPGIENEINSGKIKINTKTGKILKKNKIIDTIYDFDAIIQDMCLIGNKSLEDYYLKLIKQSRFKKDQQGKLKKEAEIYIQKNKSGKRSNDVKLSKITATLTIREDMPVKISRRMLTHPVDYLSFEYNTDLIFKKFSN